ncbi:MAG: hypothetical protein ACI97K_001797 [Glaciecola sp.]
MKFTKTNIASALLLAFAASGSLMAQEAPETKTDTYVIASDIIEAAAGNVILISQETPEGAEFGNEVFVAQEGDFNGAQITVMGDGNLVDVLQFGTDNIAVATITGDFNTVDVLQDGPASIFDTTVIGSNNEVAVSQTGGPALFNIESRSINFIEGDGNFLSVSSSGFGGHWSNNTIIGSDNTVVVDQLDEWNEAYVRELNGNNNDVTFYQDGFYNIFNLTELTGDDNTINLSVIGGGARLTFGVVGSGNDISVSQEGDDNTFSFGIFEGDDETVFVDQLGSGNLATVDTLGSSNNSYSIIQVGNGNEGYTGSIGIFNTFAVEQFGDNNIGSTVNLNGVLNNVQITQEGNGNLGLVEAVLGEGEFADANGAVLTQVGNDNDAAITFATVGVSNGNIAFADQVGELNLLDLVVNGSDNEISIYQEGENNWVTAEDGGTFQMTASNTLFSVEQIGNDNLVTGSISGLSGTVLISQVGDFNVATVIQN